MTNENKEKTVDVHLKEYEFVSSFIPMYRRFQMQAVYFSVLLYAGVVGLIGATLGNRQELVKQVIEIALPVIPWLISTFLLSFLMMEIRIIRASRYLDKTLGSALRDMLENENLLQWETEPGEHINFFLRLFSASLPLILILSLPAFLAIVAYFKCFVPQTPKIPHWFSVTGIVILSVTTFVAIIISILHEIRRKKKVDLKNKTGEQSSV